MNKLFVRMHRDAALLLGLVILAALGFGLAHPANAASTQAITASFDPKTGVLTVTGDAKDNSIVVSRNTAGAILINGGAVKLQGGKPTVANTSEIVVLGKAGNDQLALDQAKGQLPRASMAGGEGNDMRSPTRSSSGAPVAMTPSTSSLTAPASRSAGCRGSSPWPTRKAPTTRSSSRASRATTCSTPARRWQAS